jgi:phosphate acetyltransferase
MAQERLGDPITIATMMLEAGEVDGLVAGAVHTTAATVPPALELIRVAPGARLVSSVFFMLLRDEVVVYGDCAINPDPTAEELADIAVQSAESAAALGVEPRIAMISFSTGASGAGADVEKVVAATALVRERRPDLAVDGPDDHLTPLPHPHGVSRYRSRHRASSQGPRAPAVSRTS